MESMNAKLEHTRLPNTPHSAIKEPKQNTEASQHPVSVAPAFTGHRDSLELQDKRGKDTPRSRIKTKASASDQGESNSEHQFVGDLLELSDGTEDGVSEDKDSDNEDGAFDGVRDTFSIRDTFRLSNIRRSNTCSDNKSYDLKKMVALQAASKASKKSSQLSRGQLAHHFYSRYFASESTAAAPSSKPCQQNSNGAGTNAAPNDGEVQPANQQQQQQQQQQDKGSPMEAESDSPQADQENAFDLPSYCSTLFRDGLREVRVCVLVMVSSNGIGSVWLIILFAMGVLLFRHLCVHMHSPRL
jgi:hypothetical protein